MNISYTLYEDTGSASQCDGNREGDLLYDSDGTIGGYLRGDVAYSLSDQYIGELHHDGALRPES